MAALVYSDSTDFLETASQLIDQRERVPFPSRLPNNLLLIIFVYVSLISKDAEVRMFSEIILWFENLLKTKWP